MNSTTLYIIIGVILLLLGSGVTAFIFSMLRRSEIKRASSEALIIVERAKQEAQRIITESELKVKEKLLIEEQNLERQWKAKRKELSKLESELESKEERLDRLTQKLKDDQTQLELREKKFREAEEKLKVLLKESEDF